MLSSPNEKIIRQGERFSSFGATNIHVLPTPPLIAKPDRPTLTDRRQYSGIGCEQLASA
jgi:hypothetical protein